MPSFQLSIPTRNLIALSYHLKIPLSELIDLEPEFLDEYFRLLEAEAEASQKG